MSWCRGKSPACFGRRRNHQKQAAPATSNARTAQRTRQHLLAQQQCRRWVLSSSAAWEVWTAAGGVSCGSNGSFSAGKAAAPPSTCSDMPPKRRSRHAARHAERTPVWAALVPRQQQLACGRCDRGGHGSAKRLGHDLPVALATTRDVDRRRPCTAGSVDISCEHRRRFEGRRRPQAHAGDALGLRLLRDFIIKAPMVWLPHCKEHERTAHDGSSLSAQAHCPPRVNRCAARPSLATLQSSRMGTTPRRIMADATTGRVDVDCAKKSRS